jgi:integrase/recombinase XerC
MKKTIENAIQDYLSTVRMARSVHTHSTYRNAMNFYQETLRINKLPPESTDISFLKEDSIIFMVVALKNHAATTERLYLTAVCGLFEYLSSENLSGINLPKIHLLIKQRARRPGQRLPQFPSSSIDKIIEHISDNAYFSNKDEIDNLIHLRDAAFFITLCDTGLRVHEACGLHRGDIDWNEGKAMIIGKGNRQDIVRFSSRSMKAIKLYLSNRSKIDGGSRVPLTALPLFARHDRGAGKKVKPITTTTGRNIVADLTREVLGEEAVGTITPHSLRHYFVTRVLRGSGNLKLAQELARHKNIAVTQRYAHLSDDELDEGYWNTIESK